MYGYAGWIGARWYVKEVAESTAALGRYAIEVALDATKKLQLEVIYGDTDSIFIKNDAEKVAKLIGNDLRAAEDGDQSRQGLQKSPLHGGEEEVRRPERGWHSRINGFGGGEG